MKSKARSNDQSSSFASMSSEDLKQLATHDKESARQLLKYLSSMTAEPAKADGKADAKADPKGDAKGDAKADDKADPKADDKGEAKADDT